MRVALRLVDLRDGCVHLRGGGQGPKHWRLMALWLEQLKFSAEIVFFLRNLQLIPVTFDASISCNFFWELDDWGAYKKISPGLI